jgi:hypothetical protein
MHAEQKLTSELFLTFVPWYTYLPTFTSFLQLPATPDFRQKMDPSKASRLFISQKGEKLILMTHGAHRSEPES